MARWLAPRVLARVALAAALALTAVAPVHANQVQDEPDSGMMFRGLGAQPRALDAYLALDYGRYVRAREIAEEMLRANPNSAEGHCVLGVVYHLGEGSLPKALFHLKKSLALFEQSYGAAPTEKDPYYWHARALQEAATVHGAMGHNDEKILLLKEHEERYGSDQRANLGWPLMRLRRYDDARSAVTQILRSDKPSIDQIATALNALCGIEGEEQHRVETQRACMETVLHDRRYRLHDPVAYTNAAIGARGLLRFDEAERLLLEATEHFAEGTVSNPWMDLMLLYLGEGRTAEGLGAMRRMFSWRSRQPPYMDEQMRAQSDVASALLLLVAGRADDAARISERSLEQPDRTGYTSSESEQMEAASALVHTLALRVAAEQKREQASWSTLRESLRARLEAWRLDLAAWRSGRRVVALLADRRILISTVRPYLPGGVEISYWTLLELPRLLGPGVAEVTVRDARDRETLPDSEGYFLAHSAEISWLQGDEERALAEAEQALDKIPSPEVLMQAQVATIGAQAAAELGDVGRSAALLSRAIQIDPGVVRRTRASLPTRFARPQGGVAAQVIDLLYHSPRFDPVDAGGFSIAATAEGNGVNTCLRGPQNEVLACAKLERQEAEDDDAFARRIAAEFHAQAFAPRIDLTQSDIRSLDGSPTAAGGRARDRMNSILDGLVGTPQR